MTNEYMFPSPSPSPSNTNYLHNKTDPWYKHLKKSPLTPPDYVFGIVWPILYFFLFLYFILLLREKKVSNKNIIPVLIPFVAQILVNFAWAPVFFKLHQIRTALALIITMVGLTVYVMILTCKVNPYLNLLLLPYILWISFATYLNGYIVIYN